jgi:NAD+ synthetase
MTRAPHQLCPALDERAASVYRSLVEQLRAFVVDSGFSDVVVGVSGGIDSALVAALAVDALGSARVHGVIMPSIHTSDESMRDAEQLLENLGVGALTIPIQTVHAAFDEALAGSLSTDPRPVVDQNLQARIRATLLMALSNQYDWLVLSTGNLSESMVGYSTLYGDMVGAFAPLAPLYKGWVYELAYWRNTQPAKIDEDADDRTMSDEATVIPASILEKAPSAELAPGQSDEAELGSYETLDAVLYHLDHRFSDRELADAGFSAEEIAQVKDRVERARFKQRYAPPGAQMIALSETPALFDE